MFVNCIVCFVTGKGLFDDVSPFRSLAKLYLAWYNILHYFHKFIFVLIEDLLPHLWFFKIRFHEISNFLTLYTIIIPRNIHSNPSFYKFGNTRCSKWKYIYLGRNTACHRIDQQSARRRYRSLSCARRPVTVSKPLVLPGWRVIQSKAGGLGNVSRYKIRKESGWRIGRIGNRVTRAHCSEMREHSIPETRMLEMVVQCAVRRCPIIIPPPCGGEKRR